VRAGKGSVYDLLSSDDSTATKRPREREALERERGGREGGKERLGLVLVTTCGV